MTARHQHLRPLATDRSSAERFDESGATGVIVADALLDELTMTLAPIVSQFSGAQPDPDEVRRLLAGWVH